MQVPFSILTGFLGAGKTTVLNRVLAAPQGRRIAVLVNELGRVAIDSRLILSRGGDVLELAGGCVCCKIDVKNDLWDGIIDVIDRSAPDHVVLETTGIAEPGAIVDGIERMAEAQREKLRLAGVVCVVDAAAGVANLDRRDETRAQIEAADRLLLSKLDIATPDSVGDLHQRLDDINEAAERASFPADAAGTRALVPWLLETRRTGKRAHSHAHRQGQLVAASFTDDSPLLVERLLELLRQHRAQLIRAKGFLHVAGQRRRGLLQVAGETPAEITYGDEWSSDETARTELVLIGEDLDEAALRRQLWACRAAG